MTMLAFDEALLIPIISIAGAIIAGVCIIVSHAIRSIMMNRSQEQTKRELAAYVAEGVMDAQTAIALANAGKSAEDAKSEDWI